MKYESEISKQAASANNFIHAEGFLELMAGLKTKYNVGAEFSLKDVLGQKNIECIKKRGGTLIQLGKLLKNNIDNGNLKGIEPLDKLYGNAQMYRKTGEIKMRRYFSAHYSPKWEDSVTVGERYIHAPGEICVFCRYHRLPDTQNIKLEVLINGKNIRNQKFEIIKTLGECDFETITDKDTQLIAIQSVWYGLDRVYEVLQHCTEPIHSIYVFCSSGSMMRRISGEYFGDIGIQYDLTNYIQERFRIFMEGEMKELSQEIYMVAIDKDPLDKYIDENPEEKYTAEKLNKYSKEELISLLLSRV